MMFWSSFWLIWVKIPLVNRSFSQCFVQIPVARLKILSKNVVFFKLSSKKGAVLSFARDIFDLKCSKTSILADFGLFAGFTFWFFVSGYRSRGTSFQKSTEAYIEKCTKNPPKFGGGVDKSPYPLGLTLESGLEIRVKSAPATCLELSKCAQTLSTWSSH